MAKTRGGVRSSPERKRTKTPGNPMEPRGDEACRTIVETSPDGIYQVDRDGQLTFVNESFAALFGYTRDELQGKHFASLLSRGVVPRIRQMVEEVLAGKNVQDEVAVLHRDGHEIPVVYSATPLREGGETIGLTGFLKDMTDRKRAEDALRESEQRWRSLVTSTSERIMTLARDGTILYANRTSPGYSVEQVLGTSAYDYLTSDDQGKLREALEQVFTTGQPQKYLGSTIIPDGTQLWFETSLAPLRSGGEVEAALSVAIDVTDRKLAEDELQESEAKLRSVLENTPQRIITIGRDGSILSVNRVSDGHDHADVVGTSIFDYVSSSERSKIERALDSVFTSGEACNYESEARLLDGTRVWVENNLAPIWSGQRAEAAVCISTDITKRKHAEEALQKAREGLERRVRERTAELTKTNRKLRKEMLERKKVEKVLRESEERFRLITENMIDTVGLADMNMRPLYISPSVARARGYTIQELEDMPMEAHVTPESLQVGLQLLAEALNPETLKEKGPDASWTVDLEFYRKDGSTIWFEFKMSVVTDEHGHPTGFITVGRDITDRRKGEDALRESERKYRELADMMPQIVYETDADASLTYVSRKGLESTGYTAEDVEVGLSLYDMVVPNDRERARRNALSVLGGARSRGNDYSLQRKDGSTFPIIAYSSPIMRDGKPVGLRGLAIDIAERKLLEEGLRESEQRCRSLIENALDGIAIIDVDGKVVYESPAIEHVTGHGPGAMIGEDGFSAVHPDDLPGVKRLFQQLLDNPGMPASIELRTRHHDGSWRVIEAKARNLLDDPAVGGIVVNFRDITESKRAQEELRDHYEKEKELRLEVEEEMKRRVEFTRALAHELKTPLTSVIACSDMLVSECREDTLLDLADNIRRGASNLNRRIDELLDLAKGEMGMLQLQPESIDLIELLGEIADSMAPAASKRGQTLIVDLPASAPPVHADAYRVQQIVTNLLDNALKFTPKGGKITLRAEERNGALLVEVQDTGQGISQQEQEHLFEPYNRLGKEREQLSGLGLGLSLCKTLVELHGGQIWVRSREGIGSTFGFTLTSSAARQHDQDSEKTAPVWKVLIIEDNQEIVDSVGLSFKLRWPEAQLVSTALGLEGIEMAETETPNVVILDLGLPDISGFEVLRQIRLFSPVPVIILTVKSDEADMVKGLEWGADDYIVKPFRQLELLARLKVQLRKHGAPDEETPLVCGPLRLDPSTHQLSYGRQEISLTVVEGRIIQHLMQNAGSVVTHSRLSEAVWGDDYPGALDSLRVYIRYLRQKIETDPGNPKIILTKPGVGYSLVKPQ